MPRRGSNDSEKKHVTYGLVSDYSVRRTSVGGNMWIKVHHVAWKSLVRIFSLAPKLSGLRHCILSQILNFHKFFVGDPIPVVVCASKAWSICNACKNLRGSTPKVRNVVCRKMSTWVGQYEQLKRFCLWTKIHHFFHPTWKGL